MIVDGRRSCHGTAACLSRRHKEVPALAARQARRYNRFCTPGPIGATPVNTKDLIAEAASLPLEERVLLADSILRTLNPPDPEFDRQWAAVAHRRMAEVRSGAVQETAGEDVFRKIWSRFQP